MAHETYLTASGTDFQQPADMAGRLAEMIAIILGPVSKNCRIKQLTTTGTLPGIKRADKIIILFSIHTTLATRTMHNIPPET